MGGLGSGRPRGSGRSTVEAHRALDADRLNQAGCLRAGWAGGWQWGDGEQGASVSLRAEPDRLHLAYRVRVGGGEWEDIAEAVPLVRVPCRFGGTRPYFLCPGGVNGAACGRRVSKLYAAGRRFRCRHCHQLAHASQGEDKWARRLRRANTVRERVIRERLGGAPGPLAPCPPKPKGMRLRTYARLLDQLPRGRAAGRPGPRAPAPAAAGAGQRSEVAGRRPRGRARRGRPAARLGRIALGEAAPSTW
jgi:hypothetical protein